MEIWKTPVRQRNFTNKNTLTTSSNNERDHRQSTAIKRQRRPHTLLILMGLVVGLAVLNLKETFLLNGDTIATSSHWNDDTTPLMSSTESSNRITTVTTPTGKILTIIDGGNVTTVSPSSKEKDNVVSHPLPPHLGKPLLFRGWDAGRPETWSQPHDFLKRFGHFWQYVKGIDVQPLRRRRLGRNELCRVSTADLVMLVMALQKKKEMTMTEERTSDGDSSSSVNILFFTNSIENPRFLAALREDYSFLSSTVPSSALPSSLSADHFSFVSLGTRGTSHYFHNHDETYIEQIAGRKLWYFYPPSTKPKPSKKDACLHPPYISQSDGDGGATMVLQSPGDVVYFPKGWYHATCALDDWTVGVGVQKGNPAKLNQDFGNVDEIEMGQFDLVTVVTECGVLTHDEAVSLLPKDRDNF